MNKSIKGIITFPAGQISAGVHLLLCQISFHLIPSFLKVSGVSFLSSKSHSQVRLVNILWIQNFVFFVQQKQDYFAGDSLAVQLRCIGIRLESWTITCRSGWSCVLQRQPTRHGISFSLECKTNTKTPSFSSGGNTTAIRLYKCNGHLYDGHTFYFIACWSNLGGPVMSDWK